MVERDGLRSWPEGLDDGVLPAVVSTSVGAHTVQGFPALVVEPGPTAARGRASTAVALRVLADATAQSRSHADGVRELLLTELALPTGRITSRWPSTRSLTLAASPYPSTDALVTDLQRTAVGALLAESHDPATVRDGATYRRVLDRLRDAFEDRTDQISQEVAAVLTAARELDADIHDATSLALLSTVTDLKEQLVRLVHDGFVSRAGAHRLPHLARYLRAARYRLAKAAQSPQRDEGLAWQVHELEQAYDDAVSTAARAAPDTARDARLAEVPWLLEELRVSLFAQQLGTAQPVSAKRIRAALTG